MDIGKYTGKVIIVVSDNCKPCEDYVEKAKSRIESGEVVVVSREEELGRKLEELYGSNYPLIIDVEIEDGKIVGCQLETDSGKVSCKDISCLKEEGEGKVK